MTRLSNKRVAVIKEQMPDDSARTYSVWIDVNNLTIRHESFLRTFSDAAQRSDDFYYQRRKRELLEITREILTSTQEHRSHLGEDNPSLRYQLGLAYLKILQGTFSPKRDPRFISEAIAVLKKIKVNHPGSISEIEGSSALHKTLYEFIKQHRQRINNPLLFQLIEGYLKESHRELSLAE